MKGRQDTGAADASEADSRVFTFMGEQISLSPPVDWASNSRPLLWRYNLHYFDYLSSLPPLSGLALCQDWIARNPVGSGIGWDPYPVSRRIVNWCRFAYDDPEFLASLYHQAGYLDRNIETHVQGNHLIENGRALLLAGKFFGKSHAAKRWLELGTKVLLEEAAEQILDDGGHYERSPMYHAIVLEAYLDALAVLPTGSGEWNEIAAVVRRMCDFLHSMTHIGDRTALFNDSALGVAAPTSRLMQVAQQLLGYTPESRRAFPVSGYFCWRDDRVSVVVDAGPVGPDHVPGHAHADVFSYEMVVDGAPFVVDTGVYGYEAGPMRDYVRSTRAHNTVTVDGKDQVEVWDSFRIARRFAPTVLSVEIDRGLCLQGSYDGYSQLIGDSVVHTRDFRLDAERLCLLVEDRVEGKGTHVVETRLHLHPEVKISRHSDRFLLERGVTKLRLETESPACVHNGWYCPRFGEKRRNEVIVIGGKVSLPARFAYRIEYG